MPATESLYDVFAFLYHTELLVASSIWLIICGVICCMGNSYVAICILTLKPLRDIENAMLYFTGVLKNIFKYYCERTINIFY